MEMTLGAWVLTHGCGVVFWLWLLCWGGAERIEGWAAWGLIGWFAGHWSSEQIRLFALLLLVLEAAWFVLGLVKPEFRVSWG